MSIPHALTANDVLVLERYFVASYFISISIKKVHAAEPHYRGRRLD